MNAVLPRLLPKLASTPLAARTVGFLDPARGAPRLAQTPLFLVGAALTLVGAAVRVHCYAALRTLFTFELGIRRDRQLITTGPYAIVRHPSYAGAVLAGVGVVMCTLAPGSWAVECTGLFTTRRIIALWVVGLTGAGMGLRTRMKKEDRMLKHRFVKEWETWATRVPYWVLPGMY